MKFGNFILDWYSLHPLPSIFQLRWWPYMVKVLSFKLRLHNDWRFFPKNDRIQTCQHRSVHMQTSSPWYLFLHDSNVACENLMLLPWWLSHVLTYQCLYHGLISDFKGLCHLSAWLFGWVPWMLVGVPCIVTIQGGLYQIFAGIKDFGLANLCRFIRVHSIVPS